MADSKPGTPLLEPQVERESRGQTSDETKYEPHWFVLLHDDQEHSYDYVVIMLVILCGMSAQDALLHAIEVDTDGVTMVACKPRGEAESLARRISRFGGDPLMGTSCSMKASVEPANG